MQLARPHITSETVVTPRTTASEQVDPRMLAAGVAAAYGALGVVAVPFLWLLATHAV